MTTPYVRTTTMSRSAATVASLVSRNSDQKLDQNWPPFTIIRTTSIYGLAASSNRLAITDYLGQPSPTSLQISFRNYEKAIATSMNMDRKRIRVHSLHSNWKRSRKRLFRGWFVTTRTTFRAVLQEDSSDLMCQGKLMQNRRFSFISNKLIYFFVPSFRCRNGLVTCGQLPAVNFLPWRSLWLSVTCHTSDYRWKIKVNWSEKIVFCRCLRVDCAFVNSEIRYLLFRIRVGYLLFIYYYYKLWSIQS